MAKMRHDKAKQRERISKFGYEPPSGFAVPGPLTPPPPGTESDPAMVPQLFASLPELWKSITERIKLRRTYGMKDRFYPSEIFSHPSFGDGIVFEVSPTNISVLFRDGIKKLAHPRQEPDPATVTPTSYEGAYHPKLKQLLLLVEEPGADGLFVFLDFEGRTRKVSDKDVGELETKLASQFSEKQLKAYAAYLDEDAKRAGRRREAEHRAAEYLKNPAVLKILARWGSLNELLPGDLKFLFQTAEAITAGTVNPHDFARAKRLLIQAVLGGFDPDKVPPPWGTRA